MPAADVPSIEPRLRPLRLAVAPALAQPATAVYTTEAAPSADNRNPRTARSPEEEPVPATGPPTTAAVTRTPGHNGTAAQAGAGRSLASWSTPYSGRLFLLGRGLGRCSRGTCAALAGRARRCEGARRSAPGSTPGRAWPGPPHGAPCRATVSRFVATSFDAVPGRGPGRHRRYRGRAGGCCGATPSRRSTGPCPDAWRSPLCPERVRAVLRSAGVPAGTGSGPTWMLRVAAPEEVRRSPLATGSRPCDRSRAPGTPRPFPSRTAADASTPTQDRACASVHVPPSTRPS
ncbi:hypothetical protein FHR34_007420 [Kitasatospora kifunensis]|uniref:Uncharacterized protein n=1 Tax=Kitasatospora kifunensis TaxID=58351 RepID=A0A7W7RAC9_KITKI|nr:hypothetical protein [Kitasatospora kifunensis]MBB4928323.1 hypothetical protein [Kitasatospora kifunensis]